MPIAVVGLTVLLGGCADGTATDDVRAGPTTSVVATSRPTVPDPAALRMGGRFETAEGNVVQVIAYQQPVRATVLEPDAGMEFAAVEAEICAGPRGARRVTAEGFVLEMPDGARRGLSFLGPKEPAFPDTRLDGRACARGWVNFEVPEGQRPGHVAFEGSSLGRWSLGGR